MAGEVMTTGQKKRTLRVRAPQRVIEKKAHCRNSPVIKVKKHLANLAESIVECTSVPGSIDVHGRVLTIALTSFATAVLTGSPALVFCFAAFYILVTIWLEKTAA
jgi:hypothetical protein